jgi:hypothetical protein
MFKKTGPKGLKQKFLEVLEPRGVGGPIINDPNEGKYPEADSIILSAFRHTARGKKRQN